VLFGNVKMNRFLQKLNHIFRRKTRQRGLCGTPLIETAREAKRQAADSHNAEPYICATLLMRLAAEEDKDQDAVSKALEAMRDQRNDHAQEETKK